MSMHITQGKPGWLLHRAILFGVLLASVGFTASALAQTPVNNMQIYGAWHCGDQYCSWATERDMTSFDARNRWLVNRGTGQPSVNLVVLSFVHPLRLLNGTTDAQTLNGVPRGMTSAVVDYFKSRGIRVMFSIGGITYTSAWNQALSTNATQLGLNAAAVASQFGVGIDIDYEENSSPNLVGLQQFITAYRSVHPYDALGNNPAARLTIDLAAGDRWLIALTEKATKDWLNPANPVLDYANAMVPARQPRSASDAIANWQEHLDGKAQYAPPIPPLAPAKFTGSLYITGSKPTAECKDFSRALQNSTGNFVLNASPKSGSNGVTSGLLGYMFWAAECPGTRTVCTVPPNSCEGGVGAGATNYNVPIPMPALRQN